MNIAQIILYIIFLGLPIILVLSLLTYFIIYMAQESSKKEADETKQLINYLLSLSPERREIELALLQVKSTEAVASSINYQTVMQMFNKK